MHQDSLLIDALGGPAKVAELLGYNKASGGIQRVSNWRARGIPPKVKVERPDLFMRELIGTAPAADQPQAGEGGHA